MHSFTRRSFLAQASTLPLLFQIRAGAQDPAVFPGLITRMAEPENLEFPFSSLSTAITPNEQFFVRSHFAVPKIDNEKWTLSVEGTVKKPLTLTLENLKKLPKRSMKATIECAGNDRVFLTPTVAGLQWGHGAVSNAEWTGVSLSSVLEAAGLNDTAVEVILEGADKGQVNSDPKSPGPISFARSIPIAKAKSDDVILAYQMNGVDLSASHGAPLRAVVGGWYGMASVKWLTRLNVVSKPFGGFWQTLEYSYWEQLGDVPTLAPLTQMQVKSAIARPGRGEVIPAGKSFRIFGAAWAGESAVAKVEVSTDGGKTWSVAKLLDKPERLTWSLWEFTWNVPRQAGPAQLFVRATDSSGHTQPTTRDPNRRSYMINHLVPTDVVIRS